MDEWIDRGWMNGRTDGDEWLDGYDGWMDRQMNGWIDGWVNGQSNRQVEGKAIFWNRVHVSQDSSPLTRRPYCSSVLPATLDATQR